MKKVLNIIRILAISYLTIGCMANKSFAQCQSFTAATNSSIGNGQVSSSSGYSGNDARVVTGLNPMEVNVWDDPNTSGFSSNYNNGVCGSKFTFPNLSSKYRYPDVALLEDGTYWYAVVVYGISNASNYDAWYVIYQYTPNATCSLSTWTANTPARLLDPNGNNAKFDNEIHIDADANGNFVIIWDNCTGAGTNKGIQAIAGNRNTGSAPTLCTANAVLLVSGSNYRFPDVALYASADSYVHYSYLDLTFGTLYVGAVTWADICNTHLTTNNPTYQSFSHGLGYSFTRPRIAAPPNANSACYDSWTVVAKYDNGTNYEIVGWSFKCGTQYGMHTYTDGSMSGSPCGGGNKIHVDDNTDPAVGYDNGNTGIMIGWDSWYSHFTGTCTHCFNPTQSIAITCNTDGSWNTSCSAYYLLLSTYNLNNTARYLAISGRDYNNMAYDFCDNAYSTNNYKDVAFGACSLRVERAPILNNDNVQLSPNPFTGELSIGFPFDFAQVKVFDLNGNALLNEGGNETEINLSVNKLTINLPKGVYILKVATQDGSDFVNKKFVKM